MRASITSRARVPYPLWPWLVAALVVVAAAAAAVFLLTRGGDETATVHGPAGAPFTVDRPPGWESVSQEELLGLPGQPVAVLHQTDGGAVVTITAESRTKGTLPELSHQLEAKLKGEFADFKLVNSQTVKVAAGPALSLSYARTEKGTANTLLAVPTDKALYVLNAVVPAGQQEAAQEAGSILSSFDD